MPRLSNNRGMKQRGRGRVGRNVRADGRANGPRADMQRLPGGGLPQGGPLPNKRQARGRGKEAAVGQGQAAVGRGGIPGLGHQLTRRVQSGAITQEQAQRTAQQRQTLAKAFGPDWRTKVFGATKAMQSARAGLAKHPDSARFAALNKTLLKRRQQLLEEARKRTEEEQG